MKRVITVETCKLFRSWDDGKKKERAFFSDYLNSLNSRVRSLISMPESLMAAKVLGSSWRAVSANLAKEDAALPMA